MEVLIQVAHQVVTQVVTQVAIQVVLPVDHQVAAPQVVIHRVVASIDSNHIYFT